MKSLRFLTTAILFILTFQTALFAQSNIEEIFKKHFNKTVQNVEQTNDADEKRAILNTSFDKMLKAADRIEASLSDDEREELKSFKNAVTEKQNELNGLDGFDEIQDEELDDFSNYVQQDFEQANRYITISVSTALLIILILLLL